MLVVDLDRDLDIDIDIDTHKHISILKTVVAGIPHSTGKQSSGAEGPQLLQEPTQVQFY